MKIQLGAVQETLLIPLYGRAVETHKKRPLMRDPKAVEMVASIDYDFTKYDGGRSLGGSVLRGLIFDSWVTDFLRANPYGTVVEIGAGLNTRFERLDNGTCHWFELDLPDSMELRQRFFRPSDRRGMLAGSITDPAWIEAVRARPAPYFFVAEAVLFYLPRDDAQYAVALVHDHFPGSRLAFDTAGDAMVDSQAQHDALKHTRAEFAWACDDAIELEPWGLRLVDSRPLARPQPSVAARLPPAYRLLLRLLAFHPRAASYRMNLFSV
ncbi:class I SAM-dependent methyltransferase [Kribbella italica]|uniref:O-methyltransferase involved in polyketide biosynthesis n=1 Tax=Kribbella italica TaxID=1540520 RepID=A0A7W9JFB7_9ACTN|nr:class I SAM-dependent methyltransferase [Kribbella italica]MBB5841071.1 O-methyltransferase involved in polyketide biosynthesis [Kribbella italica]